VKVDYERVRDMQRREKGVAAIIELDPLFYTELAAFVKAGMENHRQTNSTEAFRELDNVLRLSRDLFDKREQKILLRALTSVRTGEIDGSHLTPEERVLYDSICSLLATHRSFFQKVLLGVYVQEKPSCLPAPETLINEGTPNVSLARVRKAVPRFVGSDSVEYGPFAAGDVIKLPKKEAEFLSQQNIVEVL
jgi:DNA replication initiation complex subunit (GINS family)